MTKTVTTEMPSSRRMAPPFVLPRGRSAGLVGLSLPGFGPLSRSHLRLARVLPYPALMAMVQDPWGAFRIELRRYMAERGVSAPALSRMLSFEVSDDTINNWRKGQARPSLELLPQVSRALSMGGPPGGPDDPPYLLQRMGLLPAGDPGEAYSLALRVQKLELRLREAIERNAEAGRDHGLSAIMRAATESQEWAVAVWPAVEGPEECRMRVADRIDLKRFDGAPTTAEEVFNDPALHRSLREAYAVPSTRAPRWSSVEALHNVSSWSISHIGAPRSPHRRLRHPGAVSVLCYAVTVESWVNDVADLLSRALGYGLTTTRDLAMEVTGIRLSSTSATARAAAHHELQEAPPLRRVWSHHAPPSALTPDPFRTAREDVPIIWIRECDALLERFAARAPGERSVRALLDHRSVLDELAARHPTEVLVVEAQHWPDTTDRWRQVLEQTATVFEWLETQGRLATDLRSQWEADIATDLGTTNPFLRWLRTAVPSANRTSS